MKYFYDTEFIESGPRNPVHLLSIGILAEDGRELYLQHWDVPFGLASDWVKENVFPQMQDWRQRGELNRANPPPNLRWLPDLNSPVWQTREAIASQLISFIKDDPDIQLWSYYADYDHVVLCQLFGTMMDLPAHFPKFTMDIKQLCVSLGDPKLPEQGKGEHHSLLDAKWNKQAYEFLMNIPRFSMYDHRVRSPK